ncbi:MAG TPA: DUF2059 domain-containing protein [Longimicrobium sp.]|nr:DUF2059 domain-containing protein [Longimicrobium sp.]
MKKLIAAAACAVALGLAGPARAQEPTPERMAAAERLVTSIDMESNYRRTMDMMIQSQMRQNPAIAPFEATMRAFFTRYLSWQQVRPDMVRVYALTYTEDEMGQLTAFYQTPLGKRLLETMPEVAARSSELTQRRLMEHMPELQQQIMQQMQAGATPPATPAP